MEVHCDLHAHSAFAGGARAGGGSSAEQSKRVRKRFEESAINSPLKGVNLIGTGDAQFEPWLKFLRSNLDEVENGIFEYNQGEDNLKDETEVEVRAPPRYILQSEVIITGPVPHSKKKKKAHMVLLFPDFARIEEFNELLDDFEVARKNMARPFMVCHTFDEIEERTHAILDLDPSIEVIPAHVLTPEGIYGSNARIDRMSDFFGTSSARFHAVETGLSADPDILGLIPELDKFTLISNADAHSAALNRVGREFTTLGINKFNYSSIISAIRTRNVIKTAEFHPTEGRYFLTGHRENRKKPALHKKSQFCYYSPKHVPKDDICPICNKELTIGVLQRAMEISAAQNNGIARKIGDGPKRDFVTMVPLVEIIANSLNMKSLTSKRVLNLYKQILEITTTEVELWTNDKMISRLYESELPNHLIKNIDIIKTGDFSFEPIGYDGLYGLLRIGQSQDYENISIINN